MSREVDNSQDILDSRDIIKRIEELESDIESNESDLADLLADGTEEMVQDTKDNINALKEELTPLKALAGGGESCSDWMHGEMLIRDSYFEDHARELAADIGAIKGDESWPCDCIDWERAAAALQQDYTSVDFGGVTYWIRS